MERKVVVNQAKCIGCGLCEKDCVSFDIKVKDGKAVAAGKSCIYCGHCEAICPQNAVTIKGFEDVPEEFDQDTRLDPKTLMQAIKTRRTIRVFRDKDVSREIVEDIIEAGRLAPTGGNSQNISYVVLEKKKAEFEAIAVGMFRKIAGMAKPLIPFIRNMNIDDNFFFKKAPLVIVIVSNGAVNASLAAENMAFMAEAHGLGVLYSGFFTMCANSNRKLKKALGIPKGQKAITTLVIGYPGVKYHRTVRRNPAKVMYL